MYLPQPALPYRDVADAVRGPSAGKRQAVETVEPPDRETLYRRIRDTLAGPGVHAEEVQYELARWVELLEVSKDDLSDTKHCKDQVLERLVREGGAAVSALLSDHPELVFARSLRVQAENKLLRHDGALNRLLMMATGGGPLMIVSLGAFVALLFGVAAHMLLQVDAVAGAVMPLVPFNATNMAAIASASFLGALVSIVSRLKAFSRLGDFDHAFLFLNALSKPAVGVVLGVFAYAVWQSGFLPLAAPLLEVTLEGLWVVGFLAGFSERFTKDLITRGEGFFSAPKKS